jgi:hypothetical protein
MEPSFDHVSQGLGRHPGGEIRLRVPELRQLFDPMDPSPPATKDLHPNVSEFITSWGSEVPAKTPVSLVIHLEGDATDEERSVAIAALRTFFDQRAQVTGRQLRKLFRLGRGSLVIALAVLALSFAAGELLLSGPEGSNLRMALGGTLEIGGGRSKSSSTIGGLWWETFASSAGWRRCPFGSKRMAVPGTREHER